jgi:hypothetical protein
MGCTAIRESEQELIRRNIRAAEIGATRPFMKPPGPEIHLFINVFQVLRQRIRSNRPATQILCLGAEILEEVPPDGLASPAGIMV